MNKPGEEIQYPLATIAFYGADDLTATKVVVAIILGDGEEPAHLQRWYSHDIDIRRDHEVKQKISVYLKQHKVKSVVAPDKIIGCPHEEGVDYPEGSKCPRCPFWANRDRWTGTIYN